MTAIAAYKRFVGNHYAGNETWSDNIHDLYRHLSRGEHAEAIALIQAMRAALNACEEAVRMARDEAA